MKRKVQTLFLAGEAGRLEALWEQPEPISASAGNPAPLAGLVCHPHPLYGGTMHNKVIHHISLALQSLGLPVLRFNFRGAGLSEGRHDEGRGEADDVRAALGWLQAKAPDAGVLLAGFSFGAWVGLRVGCADERVRGLIGVGVPADSGDLTYLESCTKPKLFVQGTRDQFGSRENLLSLVQQIPGPKELVLVEGADHFLTGQLTELRRAVLDHFPLTPQPEDG